MSKYINLGNVRLEDQQKVMQEIATNGHCPFCEENLSKYHKKPILKEGDYWLLTENQWPYDKTKNHLLAIHKKHIEHFVDMEPEAAAELVKLFKEEALKRNIAGGGVTIRFGSNPEKGTYGNTVLHLHAHLIEPDLDAMEPGEAFRFKIAQKK